MSLVHPGAPNAHAAPQYVHPGAPYASYVHSGVPYAQVANLRGKITNLGMMNIPQGTQVVPQAPPQFSIPQAPQFTPLQGP